MAVSCLDILLLVDAVILKWFVQIILAFISILIIFYFTFCACLSYWIFTFTLLPATWPINSVHKYFCWRVLQFHSLALIRSNSASKFFSWILSANLRLKNSHVFRLVNSVSEIKFSSRIAKNVVNELGTT